MSPVLLAIIVEFAIFTAEYWSYFCHKLVATPEANNHSSKYECCCCLLSCTVCVNNEFTPSFPRVSQTRNATVMPQKKYAALGRNYGRTDDSNVPVLYCAGAHHAAHSGTPHTCRHRRRHGRPPHPPPLLAAVS